MSTFFARRKQARIQKLEGEIQYVRKQISFAMRDYERFLLRYRETGNTAFYYDAEECESIRDFWERRLAKLERKRDTLGATIWRKVSILELA